MNTSSRAPGPNAISIGLVVALALGAGCDAIIGLGDEPSGASSTSSSGDATSSTGDATSSTGDVTSSTSDATSSVTSSSGGGGAGGADTTSTSGEATATAATGTGGGSGGGGGPIGTPCGPASDPFCEEEDGARCVLRRQTIPDTAGVGSTPETIIDRFGRGFVVTDDVVAFVRTTSGGSPRLTLAPRTGAAPAVDATGDLGDVVSGIALSGDGGVIAIVPRNGNPPVQKVELASLASGEIPVVETTFPGGDGMTCVVGIDEGRGFFATLTGSGQLVHFDVDAPDPCPVDGTGLGTNTLELERLSAQAGEVRVVALYDKPIAEVVTGPPTCGGDHVSMTFPLPLARRHAVANVGVDSYILGIDAELGPVVVHDGASQPAFPSMALDANGLGVVFGAPGGGLVHCGLDLTGCVTIATEEEVGEVGHVRATPFGAITVGWTEGDDAIVSCIDARE